MLCFIHIGGRGWRNLEIEGIVSMNNLMGGEEMHSELWPVCDSNPHP